MSWEAIEFGSSKKCLRVYIWAWSKLNVEGSTSPVDEEKEMEIRFTFEGVEFEVDASEYPFTCLELPGQRTVKVAQWKKTNPPIPTKLEYIDPDFQEGYQPPKARYVQH